VGEELPAHRAFSTGTYGEPSIPNRRHSSVHWMT
jgi:hypothetical protein